MAQACDSSSSSMVYFPRRRPGRVDSYALTARAPAASCARRVAFGGVVVAFGDARELLRGDREAWVRFARDA